MARTQGMNSVGEMMSDSFVHHDPVDLICDDDGMTRQEFKDECDINVLLAQYEKTGVLNHYNLNDPQYLDVTDVPDLQRALAIYQSAETAFMSLPATVRRDFDNDPVKFADFAANPDNLDKMREYKLAPPKAGDPEPMRVHVVNARPAAPGGVAPGQPAPTPAAPIGDAGSGLPF